MVDLLYKALDSLDHILEIIEIIEKRDYYE